MTERRPPRFYEGVFYHLVIDPMLQQVRRRIRKRIEPGSSVVDVGCGTGELLIFLADRCPRLAGVELSECMAAYARSRVRALGLRHIAVTYGDGADLQTVSPASFDYASASMVFHEMEKPRRLPVLRNMAQVGRTLVLVDYAAPLPRNGTGSLIRLIERLGGRQNNANFRSFVKSGGLLPLLKSAGLTVQEDIVLLQNTLHLVTASIKQAAAAR